MAGPLEGVNVVELGVWVAAPAAGGILADWGADVVKIEPPAGDPARMFGRMLGDGDRASTRRSRWTTGPSAASSSTWAPMHGRQDAIELLSDADVFVTNVRPAALQRLGLDFETVAARNPRLVYGLLTGYGMTGPDSRPARPMTSPPSGPAPGWRIC